MKKVYRKTEVIKILELLIKNGFSDIGNTIEILNNSNDKETVFEFNKYLVQNVGCDDTTEFEIELTDEELKTIIKFAQENNRNVKRSCQPYIEIYDKEEKSKILNFEDSIEKMGDVENG